MSLGLRLAKAIPWVQCLPGVALIGLMMWGMSSLQPDFASRHIYLRGALLVAALGLSFSYDDPAAETTGATPSPLRFRRGIRTLIGLTPWGVLVGVVVLIATQGMTPMFALSAKLPNALPIGRILLEASTMGAWGLAIAAGLAKRWDAEPGRLASAGLLVLYAAAWTVPDQWKPWATPGDPRWDTGLPWWFAALTTGVLIAVAFSWDTRIGLRPRRLLQRRQRESTQEPERDSHYSTA